MKDVSIKKVWMTGMTHPHLDPPPVPIIKENHDGNPDKYFVKLKLRRYPTSSTPDLYQFKMSLFENFDPEEFLLFVRNFNMILAASGTLEAGVKYKYLHTIVRGEEWHQFDLLSAEVEVIETLNIDYIITGLAKYPPPPVN